MSRVTSCAPASSLHLGLRIACERKAWFTAGVLLRRCLPVLASIEILAGTAVKTNSTVDDRNSVLGPGCPKGLNPGICVVGLSTAGLLPHSVDSGLYGKRGLPLEITMLRSNARSAIAGQAPMPHA